MEVQFDEPPIYEDSGTPIPPPDPNQISAPPPVDFAAQDKPDQDRSILVFDKLQDIIYDWYGLSVGRHDCPMNDKEWHKTLKILGSTDISFPSNLQTSVMEFVHYMTLRSGPPLPPPPRDIGHPEGHHIILQSNINIIPFNLNEQVVYHIVGNSNKPTDNNFRWWLIVHSPVVALWCARARWGPCICRVARELVVRGISFNTLDRPSKSTAIRWTWQSNGGLQAQ